MMSSAETLNFGPQWLRDLSEGSGNSATSTSPQSASITKFKLAENRYGREEMLALFVEESELPEELQRAPSLASEVIQVPLAFRPSSEHAQAQLPVSYRGRGATSGLRGRSIPSRGRGRGRGSAWADHDDGPQRRPPLLRRSESEQHWRNDSLRGKGDGAEDIIGGLKEWRLAGQRADFWKDAWRDRSEDGKEQRPPRGRALSSRDAEHSGARWRDADDVDVFPVNKKTLSMEDQPSNHTKQPAIREESNSPHKKEPPAHDGAESRTQQTTDVPIESVKPPPETFTESNGLERRVSALDSAVEAKDKGSEMGEHKTQSNKTPQTANSPTEENDKNVLEKMFQRLSANDSGQASKKIYETQLVQEARTSEASAISSSGKSSQSLPFSNNSSLGDISDSSPIAQLQALASTWYYKDPQEEVQGPFAASQMMEWFNAGYFAMVLLVKRGCDADFAPLGELIKRWGHIPFASQSNTLFPSSGNVSSLTQSLTQQQRQIAFNMKLMEGQQHQSLQQIQQPSIGRTYQQQQQQQADFDVVLAKLMQNPDFCRMSTQQQQHVVLQYVDELKRQTLASGVSYQSSVTSDALTAITTHPNELPQTQPSLLYQQKLLEEARRKEEEEMQRLQKQQEEQKELLRQQEEEFRRKKEMLMREEEQIKQLQLEAKRKKEELQRAIQEEENLKRIQEMERRKMEEEERRRQAEFERREAEQRRIREEEEQNRKEQERRWKEEEEARKQTELKLEELRRLENEREEQRIQEERRQQEEWERQAALEAETQRKMEAARIQREKEAEAKALLKKQQQEKQMQQIQLPSHARWGHGSQPMQHAKSDSLSLVEIQQLEKQQEEQTRQKEEVVRMTWDMRNQVPKPKTGWGATSQEVYGVSLLDIQREEAKQMSMTKQAAKPEKAANINFNTSWSKPPKIQPDPPKPQPQRQQQAQPSFWDQVVEENSQPNPNPTCQTQSKQQPKQAKQTKAVKKTKSDEGQQIKALFQQQIAKDSFTDWCEGYLRNMNAGSIDIPTFVNFLREVDSPYEVQEYVQSYLGESREAKDFTTLFLEQRAKLSGPQRQHQQFSQNNKIPDKSKGPRDTDGFEVVRSSAKRGKKKSKKTTQVDPNILGFSVNAASNRVNMGEIQTADD